MSLKGKRLSLSSIALNKIGFGAIFKRGKIKSVSETKKQLSSGQYPPNHSYFLSISLNHKGKTATGFYLNKWYKNKVETPILDTNYNESPKVEK